mmetsp:Transcript_45318/g.94935  ORF Transcript_45318/g.94935 Transcript_45318/m.94935 type:complete len:230 (-) Transcript_45318:655-1344(-)
MASSILKTRLRSFRRTTARNCSSKTPPRAAGTREALAVRRGAMAGPEDPRKDPAQRQITQAWRVPARGVHPGGLGGGRRLRRTWAVPQEEVDGGAIWSRRCAMTPWDQCARWTAGSMRRRTCTHEWAKACRVLSRSSAPAAACLRTPPKCVTRTPIPFRVGVQGLGWAGARWVCLGSLRLREWGLAAWDSRAVPRSPWEVSSTLTITTTNFSSSNNSSSSSTGERRGLV